MMEVQFYPKFQAMPTIKMIKQIYPPYILYFYYFHYYKKEGPRPQSAKRADIKGSSAVSYMPRGGEQIQNDMYF